MTNNMNIVDRVVERIKKQPIGDLIQEEDLYDIVKQAIPKAFFEPRKVSQGYHTHELPPLIVDCCEKVLKDHVQKAVDRWTEENQEQMMVYWKNVVDEGIVNLVNRIQNEKATSQVENMLKSWVAAVQKEREKNGLPYLNF